MSVNRQALLLSSLLLLLLWTPASAVLQVGGYNTRLTTNADCASQTCNAQSPTWCQQGTTMFMCTVANGTYGPVASGIGSGDVVGPSSSVDTALTRFNGTGGKTIQAYSS